MQPSSPRRLYQAGAPGSRGSAGPSPLAGTGQRLVWGVMTGVAFYLVNQTMSHAGQVYGLPAPLSALLPALLFFAGGMWVMRQVR